MRTLGPGSLASILKLLLDAAFYVLWALLGLASLIIVLIIFTGIYRLAGLGGLPEGMAQFLAMDVVLALPMAVVAIAAVIFIIDRLRRIFKTLIGGDPFLSERFWRYAGNSLILAGMAAALLVAVAVLLAYATRLSQAKPLRALVRVSTIGYAVPGTVATWASSRASCWTTTVSAVARSSVCPAVIWRPTTSSIR